MRRTMVRLSPVLFLARLKPCPPVFACGGRIGCRPEGRPHISIIGCGRGRAEARPYIGSIGSRGIGRECGGGTCFADRFPRVDGDRGIRQADRVFEHALPGVEGVADLGFLLGVAEAREHELGGVAKSFGFLDGDAVLGKSCEDFAEDVIDVGGGEEVAGERGGEFRADAFGFEGLALFAGVKRAKAGMIAMAKHAALAAVGVRETTEIAIVSVGTLVHER